MRLTALTLTRYGPFLHHRIEFTPERGRINLVIAPNGAGKSVLRGACADLLFGIHAQTDMGFRYGYPGMRLIAEALDRDGARCDFGRRKGTGNTLIDAAGAPLDPSVLARLLGPTDKTLLERLFALDTERLRNGGAALLASDGGLADALLSAAGGLGHARGLRATLAQQRDALAPERRTASRPFYHALDSLLDADRRLRATVLKPELRDRQETGLRQLDAALHQQKLHAQAASARITRLERIRRTAGPLRQHDAAGAWLAGHPDALTLPPDTARRLADAAEALERARRMSERERLAVEDAARRLDGIEPDTAVLAEGEAIDDLVRRSGAAAQALCDIPAREGERDAAERQIALLLRQLGSQLPPAEAEAAVPPATAVAEARRLFQRLGALRAELDRLPRERDATQREIAEAEAGLAALPPPLDLSALQHQVDEIREAGNPRQQAIAAARGLDDAAAALATARAAIPLWGERAATLPVQPLAVYEHLEARCAQAAQAARAAEDAHAQLARAEAEARARLAELERAGAVADQAAIDEARAHRDRGWQLIYRHAFTAQPPPPDETARWAGTVALPLAYERAVSAADSLADQRGREADRVAASAELGRTLASLATRIAAAEAARAAALASETAALAAWRDALAPLGLAPQTTLPALRRLLADRDTAVAAEHTWLRRRDEAEALAGRHLAASARLAALLAAPPPSGPDALAGLLAEAGRRIAAAAEAEQRRSRLTAARDTRRRDADRQASELRRADSRMAAWRAEWSGPRAALGRPEGEAPETTHALLDHFAELATQLRAADEARRRLAEMRREIAAQQHEAAALAGRAAPDLPGGLPGADTASLIDTLRQRLARQRELAARHAELLTQRRAAGERLAEAERDQDRCRIALGAALAAIGADSLAAAEPLVALADQRAAMAETLRYATGQLAEHGDGHPIEVLRAELASVDADALAGEIAQAETARDDANNEARNLSARIATERAALEAQQAETDPVRAEADRQAALATLGRVADDALVLHLAGRILEGALDGLATAGGSELLDRIGARFATLTGGAYARLAADDAGDGGARLLAIDSAFPGEAKPVAALSDGTRDQLFLALRLIAIEDHAAAAPAPPFIGDDILQTFDDTRAAAALRALLATSEHAQVILLSHHPHLRALADTLGPERVRICTIEPAA